MMQRTSDRTGTDRRIARRLALGAVAGPVLFVVSWLVLGFVSDGYTLFGHRFTDYSPISQPISGLGLGATGPFMNAAFVLAGLLLMVGVGGSFRTIASHHRPRARLACVLLLGASGAGLVIDGVFTLEAMLPHLAGFLLGFGCPVAGFAVAASYFRGVPRWQRLGRMLPWASVLTLVLLILFFVTFSPTPDGAERGVAGLVQRVGVIELQAWFVAIGLLAWRQPDPDPGAR